MTKWNKEKEDQDLLTWITKVTNLSQSQRILKQCECECECESMILKLICQMVYDLYILPFGFCICNFLCLKRIHSGIHSKSRIITMS